MGDSESIFKIRWKGTVEDSYEPEGNLDACLDLFQNHCLEHKLDRSNMIGYYGYTGALKPDRRNWVTLDQVIEYHWIHEKAIFKGEEIPVEV